MRQKSTDNQTSKVSHLPLKMLFFSYFNNHQSIQLMSDCHNAINDKITKLAMMIEENFQEIAEIVSEDPGSMPKQKGKESGQMMEVIEEEDYWATERSNQEKESLTERNRNLLVKKFNSMIGMLERSSGKFEQIMFMYKNQIKEIAKDLTKERELNVKLLAEKQMKRKELRTGLSQDFKLKKSFSLIPKSVISQKKPLTKSTSHAKNVQESEDEEVRVPPKPFCQQCLNRQKQEAQKQKLQGQEKNKWRELSTKISNLKNQLSKYEEQLIGNQAEIARLNEELRKKNDDEVKTESEEKRKIKSINTTLRGEKIVLENQLTSLRKKLQETTDYASTLQTENKKLTLQKDNLESTIKWQSNTIEDLRTNFSSGIRQEGELVNKYNEAREANLVLVEQIANQEKCLEEFVENLRRVEESFRQEIEVLVGKVIGLEEIVEQKNQTIIRLKLGKTDHSQAQFVQSKESVIGSKRQNHLSGTIMNKTCKKEPLSMGYTQNQNERQNENFEENMIKVLNKKLAIKECEIQKLKHDNELLRAEIQVYKDMKE